MIIGIYDLSSSSERPEFLNTGNAVCNEICEVAQGLIGNGEGYIEISDLLRKLKKETKASFKSVIRDLKRICKKRNIQSMVQKHDRIEIFLK